MWVKKYRFGQDFYSFWQIRRKILSLLENNQVYGQESFF